MTPLILSQDQAVDGSLAVAGDLDVAGDTLTFGTRIDSSGARGLNLFYSDGATPTFYLNATRSDANWVWQSNGGPQLKLDADNKLQLFDRSANPTVKISLDPLGTSSFSGPVQFAAGVTINGVLALPNQSTSTNASVLTVGLADQVYQRKDADAITLGLGAVAGNYGTTALGVGTTAESNYSTVIGPHMSDGGYNTVTIGTADNFQIPGNVLLAPQGGNVGIGTASPSFPLVVEGAGAYSGYGLSQIQVTSTGTEAGINLINTGFGGRSYNLFSTNDISGVRGGKFMIGDASAGVSRLTINASGNVGLGVIDPTEKLEVAGNIKASGSVSAPTITAGKIRVPASGDLSMGQFTTVATGESAPTF